MRIVYGAKLREQTKKGRRNCSDGLFLVSGALKELNNLAQGLALCKWITPIPLRPCKGLIIVGGVGPIDRGKPLSCIIRPFQGHNAT